MDSGLLRPPDDPPLRLFPARLSQRRDFPPGRQPPDWCFRIRNEGSVHPTTDPRLCCGSSTQVGGGPGRLPWLVGLRTHSCFVHGSLGFLTTLRPPITLGVHGAQTPQIPELIDTVLTGASGCPSGVHRCPQLSRALQHTPSVVSPFRHPRPARGEGGQ